MQDVMSRGCSRCGAEAGRACKNEGKGLTEAVGMLRFHEERVYPKPERQEPRWVRHGELTFYVDRHLNAITVTGGDKRTGSWMWQHCGGASVSLPPTASDAEVDDLIADAVRSA